MGAVLHGVVDLDDEDAVVGICCIGCRVFLLVAHLLTNPTSSNVAGL